MEKKPPSERTGTPFKPLIMGGIEYWGGPPQGSPTSPLLATLPLIDTVLRPKKGEALMYADDGLFHGELGKIRGVIK